MFDSLGKPYAFMALGIVMATILQKFEVEANGKLENIELKTDISVRSKNGYFVTIKPRSGVL